MLTAGKEKILQRVTRLLPIVAIIVISTCYLIIQFTSNPDPIIQSDLQYLLPVSEEHEKIKVVNDTLSAKYQNRFILLIQSKNIGLRDRVVNQIKSKLMQVDSLKLLDIDNSQYDDMVLALTPYKYYLVNHTDKYLLQKDNVGALIENAFHHHLGFSPNISFLPIYMDPLKLFERYLFSYSATLPDFDISGENIIIQVTDNHEVKNYVPLFYEHSRNASISELENAAQVIYDAENFTSEADAKQVEIIKSGFIFHSASESSSAKSQLLLISIISILMISFMFIYFFKVIHPLLFTLVTIAFACLGSIAIGIYAFSKLHILTIVFGTSLMGVIVDYTLHYFIAFYNSKNVYNHAMYKHITKSTLLAVTTTVLGYLCLSQASMPVLKQISFFCTSGIILAWLFTVLTFPLMSSNKNQLNLKFGLLKHFSKISLQPYQLALLLFVACMVTTYNWEDSPNLNAYYNPSDALVKNDLAANRIFSTFDNNSFLLAQSKSPQSVLELLERIEPELSNMVTNADIEGYDTLTKYLPSIKQQKENYEKLAPMYMDSASSVYAMMKTLGVSSKSRAMLQNDYSNSKSNAVLTPEIWNSFALDDQKNLWLGKINQSYVSVVKLKGIKNEATLNQLASDYEEIEYINNIENLRETMHQQKKYALLSLLIAYLLTGTLLWAYFRRLAALKIILLPLFSSALTVAIISIMWGGSINFFHVMGLFLLMGLGLDYGIFLYSSQSRNPSHVNACKMAILLSFFTTVLSFGLLSFVSMPLIKSFGQILLIGGVINYLLLPIINSKQDKKYAE